MITAFCIGGPLDGKEWTSRCPKGFLVVNRPRGEVAIYDYRTNRDQFMLRYEDGKWRLPELLEGERNRYRAALEPNYDVAAYDPEVMTWEL